MMPAVFAKFGVKPVINACGIYTDLGGSRLSPTVWAAMEEMNRHFVRIPDLLDHSGAMIAGMLGAEAARVTPGAAAAIALGTCACIAGMDGTAWERLPDTTGLKSEVIIQRGHRYKYDRQVAMTGAQLVHVPYKSAGPAMTDLLGGHIDLMFATLPSALGHVKNGELRAVAIGSAQRIADLPDVPTISESGVKGYEASGWSGVLVPAGTPPAIVRKINTDLGKVLRDPELKKRFATDGAAPTASTEVEFAETIKNDLAKWGNVVRSAGITAD